MNEIIGIIATLFVLLSFLFKDAKTIRTVNIIGAILFVVYGWNLHALSVWLLNGVLVAIHILYILKERGK